MRSISLCELSNANYFSQLRTVDLEFWKVPLVFFLLLFFSRCSFSWLLLFKESPCRDRVTEFSFRKESVKMALHNILFKRTSTFALTVVIGAFLFERTLDVAIDTVYDKINEGKQWKDIKKNYSS